MSIEGCLNISLHLNTGRVDQVCIESSRPIHASSVFCGKRVQQAQQLLPLVFSICGTAQACAGARAREQAQGNQAEVLIENIRSCLVRMETIREHLWRILLDWPVFIGEKPGKDGMSDILSLQRDYRQAISGGSDPFWLDSNTEIEVRYKVLPALIQNISRILERRVFGIPPSLWLRIEEPAELAKWAAGQQSIATRFLNHVEQSKWNGVGRCNVRPLPILQSERIREALQNDEFVAFPQWSDKCCETSSYTRTMSPLLQCLHSRYGNGLLTRLVARLTELAQLSECLFPDSRPNTMDVADKGSNSAHNPGIGQVSAARGQLLHCVQLEGDTIARYQIVAPTEWNFHPQGVVAESLATLCGDAEQIEQQARLLINAIDPCVAYELGVN